MATINNAIQEMVDHLVTKMRSNEKLSAEEQTLVSNAIQKLSSSANLEAALVAVAEEHLDDATDTINNASDLVKELQAKLLEQSAHLSLLPGLEAKFNEITANLVANVEQSLSNLPDRLIDPTYRLGEPEFRLDYYDNTAAEIASGSQAFGACHMLSMANYDAGTFSVYYDAGTRVGTANPAAIVTIDAKGDVAKATRIPALVPSDGTAQIGMFVLPDNNTTLFSYTASSKQLTTYKAGSFTVESLQELDYFKLYQDKDSKKLYSVDAGILHEFDGVNWVQKVAQTFVSESAFESWAISNGLLPLHTQTITPTSVQQAINAQTGFGTTFSALPVTRPPNRKELAVHNNEYHDMPVITQQNLVRYNEGLVSGQTTNYAITRSFKGRVHLPAFGNTIRATLESVSPSNNNSTTAAYHGHGHPQFIAYSPIHNALLVYQYFQFYYSGSNIKTDSLSRVYFA
ncbi:hypothetical protein [Pseudoalteromonas byunsanensis]|uniref:Uncharacterized protein n=1 Tax=Pseudoalteromonas byunsanensis TaxID=327939 RepID=A0A1S1N6Q1_9GAMM|nr:hypothetical protein [Pseudoalteromonas byunsanensis]OHU96817.1 hypothetical protein BIW53_05715 [Pseudoalteromonas byunsanensis]